MPTNQIKQYNSLLDLMYPTEFQNIASLRKVFDRDFVATAITPLRGRPIHPTFAEGEDKMDRLFRHLTTVITDEKTRKREFESERSIRIHWIRFHIAENKKDNMIIFLVEEENKTYILDTVEKYVIVLESLRDKTGYYLLTAFCLLPARFKKMMDKYRKRGVRLSP